MLHPTVCRIVGVKQSQKAEGRTMPPCRILRDPHGNNSAPVMFDARRPRVRDFDAKLVKLGFRPATPEK